MKRRSARRAPNRPRPNAIANGSTMPRGRSRRWRLRKARSRGWPRSPGRPRGPGGPFVSRRPALGRGLRLTTIAVRFVGRRGTAAGLSPTVAWAVATSHAFGRGPALLGRTVGLVGLGGHVFFSSLARRSTGRHPGTPGPGPDWWWEDEPRGARICAEHSRPDRSPRPGRESLAGSTCGYCRLRCRAARVPRMRC